MQLGILGKGAIGSLIAAKCHAASLPCKLLTRNSDDFELSYQMADGKRGSFKPQICHPDITETFDVLLVTTKAYDVSEALTQWQKKINRDTVIVLMNNGMGPHEVIAELWPHNPVVAVITSYGAYRPIADAVVESGTGNSAGGWLNKPKNIDEDTTFNFAVRVIDFFDKVMPQFVWHPNVYIPLWQKLAINAVINPLTALHRVPNGHLATGIYQKVMIQLINELQKVMAAEGVHITTSTLTNTVNQVVAATAKNISSMYQDVLRERRTEIDMITGYLLRVGERHNISLPHHASLYRKVKKLEESFEPHPVSEDTTDAALDDSEQASI